jgi:SNF2 family DNA or RNA helicase
VHLLDGGMRLGPTFYGFRASVCEPHQIGWNKNAVQWRDKPGAEEAVFGLIADITIRHKFEDCVDIPETHQYSIEYQLTPKQFKTYKDMEQAQILLLSGKSGAGPKISAVNAAAVSTKLMQISSGAVYDNDHKHHVIDTARYEMLMDLAEARRHPLVFFFWQHQRDALVAEATKRGMTFCVLDGSATDAERNAMVTQYQLGQYDVMLAHPKSAAHGLTLTNGNATIWPCPPVDLEWWKQGNKRQARIGQKRKTEVIVVIATGTIEERVYREILMAKDARMSNLLDLFAA